MINRQQFAILIGVAIVFMAIGTQMGRSMQTAKIKNEWTEWAKDKDQANTFTQCLHDRWQANQQPPNKGHGHD